MTNSVDKVRTSANATNHYTSSVVPSIIIFVVDKVVPVCMSVVVPVCMGTVAVSVKVPLDCSVVVMFPSGSASVEFSDRISPTTQPSTTDNILVMWGYSPLVVHNN